MKKHERKHLRVNFIDMFWLSANVAGAADAAATAAAASRFTHAHTVRTHKCSALSSPQTILSR